MKQGTTETVKFKKLKRRLGLPEWQAVGLLESLWRLTATSAPQGDLGKLSNEDIAASIEYDGDCEELIQHLVECGWLEESNEERLRVCNWDKIRRGRMPPVSRQDLQTADWRRIRLVVINEDGAICAYCGTDCSEDPTVDHVIPVALGGSHDRENLVVACRQCNGRKADKRVVDG